jgi:hypothetical protein
MQRINYNPRMTRRLIEQGMFRSSNLVVMDAGARGGANSIPDLQGRVARMSSERQELKAEIKDLKRKAAGLRGEREKYRWSREFRLGRRTLRMFGAANRA